MRFFSHSHSVRKFLKILSIYIVSRFWLVCTKNNGRIIGETGTIFNENVSSGQKSYQLKRCLI